MMQQGRLHTFVHAIARTPDAAMWFRAHRGCHNLQHCRGRFVVGEERSALASNSPVAFATLTVIFFVAEQFGVGGNLLFYDRYILQVAPFLGIIAFSLLPRITPRLLVDCNNNLWTITASIPSLI
jgi:hypothetical protein